jgi:hypothetical protein
MKKSALNALGIAAVMAALVAGCGGDANPVNPGVGSKLSVNGARVYGEGALESKYTGSFSYSDGSGSGPLANSFANPVVSMTDGKLTVNLDKPTTGLIPVQDFLDELDKPTFSDSAAEIFQINYLGDGCYYESKYDHYFCSAELFIYNVASPYYDFILLYADRDVTIGGNVRFCERGDDNDECVYFRRPISINLKFGWNAVGLLDSEEPDDNSPLITYNTNVSGSGDIKWFLYASDDSGDDYSNFVIPAPTRTPTQLVGNAWTDGSITSTAFGSAAWYSFNAVRGETYHVFWNDGYYGDGTKTLDVRVSAVYSGGPNVFINHHGDGWRYPSSFTADTNGTVQIRVVPYYPSQTGTFAIAYNTSGTRPGATALSKSAATDSRGDAVKRQKSLKDRRVNSLFKRF